MALNQTLGKILYFVSRLMLKKKKKEASVPASLHVR